MSDNSGTFYHQTVPVAIRVAQCIGITTSGFLAGQIAALSIFAVPAFMEAPAPLLARQWNKAYDKGKVLGPALAAGSSFIWGSLALREPADSTAFTLYTTAAVLIPCIVPYTIVVMRGTNKKLLDKVQSMARTELTDKAVEAGVARKETTHALTDKWATLNMGRALIVTVGTICGVLGALSKIKVVPIARIELAAGAERMG